jgi:DNA polymerase
VFVPTLQALEREAATCTRCRLAAGRTNVVFGMGDPNADLMLVGEGPGAEEDRQGLPFVGRSGKLLDQLMLEETGLKREEWYTCNVLKCRPPGNRDPQDDEIATCRPFLEGQVELIDPAVIMTLGNFSTKLLLDTTRGITKLRGHVYRVGRRLLVPTFHPSAALRSGGETVAAMRADMVRARQALVDVRAGRAVAVAVL